MPTPIAQNATEPALQIVGETTRLRIGDPTPTTSPWFDGHTLAVTAARGETIGLQIIHRADGKAGGSVELRWPGNPKGITSHGYAVEPLPVTRPSTGLYGGSHGPGWYADGLGLAGPTGKELADAPSTDPAYFEIEIGRDAAPGVTGGELIAGTLRIPVSLTITAVTLPPLPIRVWAYEDAKEAVWAGIDERLCIDTFRRYGVLLSPDIHFNQLPDRQVLLSGPTTRAELRDVPVWISEWPPLATAEVKAWIAAFRGTGQVPFAIPIDEPRSDAARQRVRELADAVRAAGGGPQTFRFAVTDAPDPIYGDAVDLYISPAAAHLQGDRVARWTYNGAPPRAGAMVLDAESPGMRTWGWIAWRWQIPIWYVWDATYWHDRHNRQHLPLPLRALDVRRDAVSFDDGEDHGNLDGVLALPGCRPTLRLAALRRGYQDYQLLDQAAACDRAAADKVAAAMVPTALGDAPVHGAPSWPSNEASWESARRQLLTIAASCAKQ